VLHILEWKILIGLSSKRMYYPQSYHHIQEIQKYNIQDYRPRYVSAFYTFGPLLIVFLGWSSSRKPSGKYVKYNACANNVDMLFRRPTNHKRGYCKLMIPLESVVDMEKWQVQGQLGDDETRWERDRNCMMFGYSNVCFNSSKARNAGKPWCCEI
jgi:hypothetical protein